MAAVDEAKVNVVDVWSPCSAVLLDEPDSRIIGQHRPGAESLEVEIGRACHGRTRRKVERGDVRLRGRIGPEMPGRGAFACAEFKHLTRSAYCHERCERHHVSDRSGTNACDPRMKDDSFRQCGTDEAFLKVG